MELIRKEVFDFIDSWNNHRIRHQRNRPNHPTGRPWMMYFYPNVRSYGTTISSTSLVDLKNDLHDYGMFKSIKVLPTTNEKLDLDEYLPLEIVIWVDSILSKYGLHIPVSWMEDHHNIYIILRREVQKHCYNGNRNPTLRLTSKPTGVFNWRPSPQNIEHVPNLHLDMLPIEEEEWEDVSVALLGELEREPNA